MTIDRLREQWERLGRDDPMWAVLTLPGKRGGRWDADEFFATGRERIDAELTRLEASGRTLLRRSALDFGCGVGRLTQALAAHFDIVCGVDVSAAMIEEARKLNRFPQKCRFVHNPEASLSRFEDGSFDLVISHLVLQHIPPDLAFEYVREMLRVVTPSGVLVFGLTSEPRGTAGGRMIRLLPERLLNAVRRRTLGFEMYGTPGSEVEERLAAMGGRIVGRSESTTGHWEYCTYTVVREKGRG